MFLPFLHQISMLIKYLVDSTVRILSRFVPFWNRWPHRYILLKIFEKIRALRPVPEDFGTHKMVKYDQWSYATTCVHSSHHSRPSIFKPISSLNQLNMNKLLGTQTPTRILISRMDSENKRLGHQIPETWLIRPVQVSRKPYRIMARPYARFHCCGLSG